MRPTQICKSARLSCVLIAFIFTQPARGQLSTGDLPPFSGPIGLSSQGAAGNLSDDSWSRSGPLESNNPTAGLRPIHSTIGASTNQPAAVTTTITARGSTEPAAVTTASYSSTDLSGSRTPLPPRSTAAEAKSTKTSGGTFQLILSVGSSLAIVIGLFIGIAMLYRKSLASSLGRGLPKSVVHILGRTTVAPRQQLLLLRFGSKLVLVSMVQGEARAISEITDPLEVDQLAGLCESQQAGSVTNSFREMLSQGARA